MHKINYSDDIDLSKTSRRGSFNKSKIPSEAVRSYCVSVRLNVEELQLLNIKRGSYKKGEWLRMASLQKLSPNARGTSCCWRNIFFPSST